MRGNQYSKTGTFPNHWENGVGRPRRGYRAISQFPQVGRGESNTNSGFAERWDSDRTLFLVHRWKGVLCRNNLRESWGSQRWPLQDFQSPESCVSNGWAKVAGDCMLSLLICTYFQRKMSSVKVLAFEKCQAAVPDIP